MSEESCEPCLSLDGTRPVTKMIITGRPVEPDLMQDLNAEIRFAVDCCRSPWCPAYLKPLLRDYIEKATALLNIAAC